MVEVFVYFNFRNDDRSGDGNIGVTMPAAPDSMEVIEDLQDYISDELAKKGEYGMRVKVQNWQVLR